MNRPPSIFLHDYAGHFVNQDYVPTEAKYYEPGSEGYEDTIRKRMEHWESVRTAARKNKVDRALRRTVITPQRSAASTFQYVSELMKRRT